MISKKMQEAVAKLKADMLKNAGLTQKAEVGIHDETIAEYAVFQEYGWVQRVSCKQHYFFKGKGMKDPPKPGFSLVSPPRPFFRASIDAYSDQWAKLFLNTLKSKGPGGFTDALVLTARKAVEDIQQTVIDGGTPNMKFDERSPMTMELYQLEAQDMKGQKSKKRNVNGGSLTTTKPLEKSGAMFNAISYQLKR